MCIRDRLGRALKKAASRTCRELEQIDFNEKSTRSILKIVGINFILLTVLCSLWFYGIFGLLVYSAVQMCIRDSLCTAP